MSRRFIITRWKQQTLTLLNPETKETREVIRTVPAHGYWIGPGRPSVVSKCRQNVARPETEGALDGGAAVPGQGAPYGYRQRWRAVLRSIIKKTGKGRVVGTKLELAA
jgi:hypothetical protein